MIVRLTQLDGRLPNLALMGLAHHHRQRGDEIHFSRSPYRGLLEPEYDRVYGSAIFSFTSERVARLRSEFPGAVVGGTWNVDDPVTVEQVLGEEIAGVDYSIDPKFDASLGFTQRGCRLKCKFCVVPGKEGKPKPVATIADIWRGPGHPRHIHLLDNDFFGQPREEWQERIRELNDGSFKVCFNQGINIRMITEEVAGALASVDYRDDSFKWRRLYTAWDSLGDEARFFRGVDILADAGIPPSQLTAYMLVGYDPRETWERVIYRLNKMQARGIWPYPMIYGDKNRGLPLGGCNQRIAHRRLFEFQRYVIRKAYEFIEFEDYDASAKGRRDTHQQDLFEVA